MAKATKDQSVKTAPQTHVIVKGKLVKLRARKLPKGGETLYLDYNENGKRKYDFLGLHLMESPKLPTERQQNRDNQLLADREVGKLLFYITGRFSWAFVDATQQYIYIRKRD